MKKHYAIIPTVALVTILSAGAASAYGSPIFYGDKADPQVIANNWEFKLTQDAKILGISLEEMKNYWSQGQDIWSIAKEKGLSQENIRTSRQNAQQEMMKLWLANLVSQEKISQEQANLRLASIENKHAKKSKSFGKHRLPKIDK